MRSVKFVEVGRLFISDKNKEKKMLLSSKMVNRTHIMRPCKHRVFINYSTFSGKRQLIFREMAVKLSKVPFSREKQLVSAWQGSRFCQTAATPKTGLGR